MTTPCGPVRRARLAASNLHDYLRTIESTGEIIPADAIILTHSMTALGAYVDRVIKLAERATP